jgi:hypothetical protein
VTIAYSDAPTAANCTGKAGIDRTWYASDACKNTNSCVQHITFGDRTPPSITCPAAVSVSCAAHVPAHDFAGGSVGADNCGGPVTVAWVKDVMSLSNCFNSFTITRTYSASDSCGNSNTCTQVITVNDSGSPIITCPPNVSLTCDACNTDPANTGRATATDNCANPVPTITYTDVVSGSCPGLRITKRTWKATDACGHSQSCVQTIYCSSGSLVTDTMLCTLPTGYCSSPGPSFRLLFTQDPQNWPCYKVTSSNPGQFYYNLFYVGNPGSTVVFNLSLPYPWVTQGAQPIHGYDGVTTTTSGGITCLTPSTNVILVVSTQVTTSSYSPAKFGTYTYVPVSVTVPASGIVYLNIHLDYGLKGTTGYGADASLNATVCGTNTIAIPNTMQFTFGATTNGLPFDADAVTSCNSFKKNPGVGGLVQSGSSSDGVLGANAVLKDAKGSVIVSGVTDDDGWYICNYKYTGKAATFYVTVTIGSGKSAWTQTHTITLQANKYVEDDYTSP